ncbi:hypothetical protein FNV43_RR02057 [Rhamnella rubrinervis]|uniref:ENTH domain-containing protein n=1 Tax=Rhamnella rubrinervis TaxID=2594499 RepID=A0A8K0MTT9_9ROSA|nr:hypothetical protein FNV43_RR02057 [Rhamnella rubrinervis]
MKKVFDQTVRDLKREVNKKVLKVPGIEQKVLDATSNEPWGPHGSLLADIAMATRNYHEYQMIMAVIWKRINDTGKNWRHVYKALTVLEYLVAHGSERVIDDIREHAYQISTLSEFQYIDSGGRDQGNNVRKKSQSLVVLVNDKERIIEVRQKAAANKDKFRNTSAGGMYRPGGYGDRYDDDRYEGRYGGRDEYRNGREREMGYRDEDRYGRNGDPYRDGDRYGREYEDRYGRDAYRDDDYRGRSQNIDDYLYGSRSRSSDRDRDRDRSIDDDGHSSRGSGAKADDYSQNGRRLERKFSEQNIGAPPSYEEAVNESRSPVHSERDGETSAASAPRASSPPVSNNPASSPPADNHPFTSPPVNNHPSQSPPVNNDPTSLTGSNHPGQETNTHDSNAAPPAYQEVEAADEFDPRIPVSAAPTASNNAEVDFLGSLSDPFMSNSLAVVPITSDAPAFGAESHVYSGSAPTFGAAPSASNVVNESFEDPFGDSPFKAVPSANGLQAPPQASTSSDSFQPIQSQNVEQPQAGAMGTNFEFGDSLSGIAYSTSSVSSVATPPTNNFQFSPQELPATNQNTDILADILPPTGPSPSFTAQQSLSAPGGLPAQPGANAFSSFQPQPGAIVPVSSNMVPQTQNGHNGGSYLSHGGFTASQMPTGQNTHFNSGTFVSQQGGFTPSNSGNFYGQQGASTSPMTQHLAPQPPMGQAANFNSGNFNPQQGSAAPVALQGAHQTPTGLASQHSNDVLGNLLPQTGPKPSVSSPQAFPNSTGALVSTQPSKDKFEPKSAVWADTLSRGLVNLNISGPKTNPLSDIGIDFDAINRKERRLEKPSATPVVSSITMGKAMGSGSGIGRAGASAIRAPSNPMMGSGMGPGMGMGMGGVSGGGMGMGGYGGGAGINQPMGMGMGMNMGMGQGMPMQQPSGLPSQPNMGGGYNPMMGTGGYAPQQPYGGYR